MSRKTTVIGLVFSVLTMVEASWAMNGVIPQLVREWAIQRLESCEKDDSFQKLSQEVAAEWTLMIKPLLNPGSVCGAYAGEGQELVENCFKELDRRLEDSKVQSKFLQKYKCVDKKSYLKLMGKLPPEEKIYEASIVCKPSDPFEYDTKYGSCIGVFKCDSAGGKKFSFAGKDFESGRYSINCYADNMEACKKTNISNCVPRGIAKPLPFANKPALGGGWTTFERPQPAPATGTTQAAPAGQKQ